MRSGHSVDDWLDTADHRAVGRVDPPAAHEPGLELVGAEIGLVELGEFDPFKVDLVFNARDRIGRGRLPTELFHVEHEVDFMAHPLRAPEDLLGREQQGAGFYGLPAFFDHFAFEGDRGGLCELDMPSGQVEIAVLQVFAQQHSSLMDEQAACDDLDMVFLGHRMIVSSSPFLCRLLPDAL